MDLWNGPLLIALYKAEPVLWDPNHPEYEHERKSNEAWERLKARMGPRFKVEDLKRKMVSLKRMYHQHKRENSIPNDSCDSRYFRLLDFFLGKTSTYVTTADSTQVQKIKDIEGVKTKKRPKTKNQKLRDTRKDLATAKDDVKALTQQVVNLQLENKTLREEVEKITKDLATSKDDVKELTQQVVNVKVKDAGVPQQEDVCGLYGKLLVEKLRHVPESKRLSLMLELDGIVYRHLDIK